MLLACPPRRVCQTPDTRFKFGFGALTLSAFVLTDDKVGGDFVDELLSEPPREPGQKLIAKHDENSMSEVFGADSAAHHIVSIKLFGSPVIEFACFERSSKAWEVVVGFFLRRLRR